MQSAPLTLGIEEEYQIIDPETRELTSYVQQMIDRGQVVLGEQIKTEFMKSQLETGTNICRDVQELREEVRRVRGHLIDIADAMGVSLVAAGTHPFSHWSEQTLNDSDRYREFVDDMQYVVRNLLTFGTHVHIGFGDSPQQRALMITIMNQVRYFLPHILALSTSSPFWLGHNTGLKSYRTIVFKALPRTGLPMEFRSWAEYEGIVDTLTRIGALGKHAQQGGDATRIWWDIRPHPRYATLEFRIMDSATTLDEAICIGALLQALVAKLIQLRENNQAWRIYRRDLINENKWRAVRYGIDGKLIDFGKEAEVSMPTLIDEILDFVDDVVDKLGCRSEVEYARMIVANGTSADRQLKVFRSSLESGKDEHSALLDVVDHLIKETRFDIR